MQLWHPAIASRTHSRRNAQSGFLPLLRTPCPRLNHVDAHSFPPKSSNSASPQPLPLPEFKEPLRRNPNFFLSSSDGMPLPAPAKIQIKRGDKGMTEAEAIDRINDLNSRSSDANTTNTTSSTNSCAATGNSSARRRGTVRSSSEMSQQCYINVHPLPLPPRTVTSPVGDKPKLKPVKSQWLKGKLIGKGSFGSVYVASNRETGALCAMKEVEISLSDSKSAESLRQLEQEIKVLSHLKHRNIVQYYGSETIGDKLYIYLEYVYPGSINRFIHDHCGGITESVVRNFTRHILSGLAYLHGTKTIHRDIKCDNLLVDTHGVVKIADFGVAKHLQGETTNLSMKGSPYWLAPELLQYSMQAEANPDAVCAVDIWSLGCTVIEMMNGRPPWSEYEGAAALFKVLKETPSIPERMSAEGKHFLRCCFRRNPADRPTASQLLEHPFVSHLYHPETDKEMRISV